MPPGLSSHEQLIQLRKRARRRLVGAIALVLVATTVLWNVVGHVPDQKLKPQSINIVELNSSAPAGEPSAKAASQAAAVAVAAATGAAQTELPAALSEESSQTAAPATPATPVATAKPEPAAPSTKVEEKKPEPVKQAEAPKLKPQPEEKLRAEEKPKAKKTDPAAILEGRVDSEDAPKPKAERTADESVKPSNGKVMIQLAALSDPDKVDALRSKLANIGGMSAHFSKVQTSKGEVTRVRVGPFSSASEAQSVLSRLAKAGITGIVVSH